MLGAEDFKLGEIKGRPAGLWTSGYSQPSSGNADCLPAAYGSHGKVRLLCARSLHLRPRFMVNGHQMVSRSPRVDILACFVLLGDES